MSVPNSTDWYLIDFGLSHMMDVDVCSMAVEHIGGSWLYCSRNTHKRIQSSFKNDFESLAFLIIHHIKRVLSWSPECIQFHQKAQANTNESRGSLIKTIFEKKQDTIKRVSEIRLPHPFQTFIETCFEIDDLKLPPHTQLNNILK